jgi:hypothetical protein
VVRDVLKENVPLSPRTEELKSWTDVEDEGIMILGNISNHSPNDKGSRPKTPESSSAIQFVGMGL